MSYLCYDIANDYYWGDFGGVYGCSNPEYSSWLNNGQLWWTRLAMADDSYSAWIVRDDGRIGGLGGLLTVMYPYYSWYGIRPVITIPKELARLYSLKKYFIGEEVSVGSEKFNVIRDNGTTVTMLAQYSLGSNYRQSTSADSSDGVEFSNNNGWEYTPGPKEIDIQQFDGPVKTYVNEYVSYLSSEIGDSSHTGTLITMTELETLGCTISDDYSYASDCSKSEHKSWLVNGQHWWTRSAFSNNAEDIWYVNDSGYLFEIRYTDIPSVRPVITINKKYLN